jgi:uncharacterized membrane protein YciS (DUF1049 family)
MKQSDFLSLWAILAVVWALGMAAASFLVSGIFFDRFQAAVLQSAGRILRKNKNRDADPSRRG